MKAEKINLRQKQNLCNVFFFNWAPIISVVIVLSRIGKCVVSIQCFCVFVINTDSAMSLTSVADGGQSSWFLSEIRVAELSTLRSADGHQCCYLCFHSPAEHIHTQSHPHGCIKPFHQKSVFFI